jgi:hypothetical protein
MREEKKLMISVTSIWPACPLLELFPLTPNSERKTSGRFKNIAVCSQKFEGTQGTP